MLRPPPGLRLERASVDREEQLAPAQVTALLEVHRRHLARDLGPHGHRFVGPHVADRRHANGHGPADRGADDYGDGRRRARRFLTRARRQDSDGQERERWADGPHGGACGNFRTSSGVGLAPILSLPHRLGVCGIGVATGCTAIGSVRRRTKPWYGWRSFAPAGAHRLAVCRPCLPAWLAEVAIRVLRVGDATVDLCFSRRPDGGGVQVDATAVDSSTSVTSWPARDNQYAGPSPQPLCRIGPGRVRLAKWAYASVSC